MVEAEESGTFSTLRDTLPSWEQAVKTPVGVDCRADMNPLEWRWSARSKVYVTISSEVSARLVHFFGGVTRRFSGKFSCFRYFSDTAGCVY